MFGLVLLGTNSAIAAPTANPACSGVAVSTITAPTSSNITGNTCNHNNDINSNIANVCSNNTGLNGAGADVYGITLGANYNNVSITVTPTGWFAGIYLMPSSINSCGGNGQPCKISAQAGDTNALTATIPTGLTAGTYYIVVGDAGSDATGCGAYNLAVSGTLPVKLQKFSVN